MAKKEQTTTREKKKQSKQVSIFTILFVVAILLTFVGVYLGIRWLVITLKYRAYTEKMVSYGYNELYDNQKATSIQKVTNKELFKVAIGSIKNDKNIFDLYYLADKNRDEVSNWYDYASYIGVSDVMSDGALNDNATVIDAAMITTSCIEMVVDTDIPLTKLEMSEKELNKYTKKQQDMIAKAVTLGLIKNKTSSLDESNVLKGQLNKMIISVVEKYATMHYDNSSTNKQVNIVTDKDKMPKNYKEYPYIIDTISKDVYEYDYNIMTKSQFVNPKETYKTMGYLNGQTADLIERYFDKILNIDYTTITEKNFANSITKDVVYALDEQDVQAYVDYVKQNKIKLQGSATPLLPIMYNNGEQYVVRTKITFKVLSSDTEYNLLFGDENEKIKYDSKDITIYVDVQTGMTLNARSLLVQVTTLARDMVNPNSVVVIEE